MNESQEEGFRIEIPLFEPGEFESIDEELNNIDTLSEIVRRATEQVVKEREQALSQLIMSKQQKEIERLKKREQECIDHYLAQCKYASEMESKYITANNIINEFKKLLKKERTRTKYAHDVERFTAYDYMLKKLQELKGVDKE